MLLHWLHGLWAATVRYCWHREQRQSAISLRAALLSVGQVSDNTRSIAVAAFYFCCSISMNFLNKIVVSTYEFNYPYFIMICQMAITLLFVDGLRLLSLINLSPYSLKEGRDFFPASLCFALHATLSLSALHGMNIPMYGAIKRCTPLVSLILSVTLLRKQMPSRYIVVSILLITGGCLIASIGDLEFDKHAYFMGLLSVFAQGGYLTLVQKSSETMKSTLDMVHINSYNTLPFFIIMSIVMNEPIHVVNAECLQDNSFFLIFFVLITAGCVLTYSQFLCAGVCSALTASLVGVSKSILQTFIGFFTFGGVQFNIINIIGIVMNTLGGCVYTFVKYKEGRKGKLQMSCTSPDTEKLIRTADHIPAEPNGFIPNGKLDIINEQKKERSTL